MEDNYSHDDNQLIYVFENVPGPSDNSKEQKILVKNLNSQLCSKCDCENGCKLSTCSCVDISGGNYVMNLENSIIKLNEDKINDGITNPIIECNDLCSCSVNCGNRLVQKGPLNCLYVKSCSNDKGYGLYTTLSIPKYTFVCEYAGEVITKTQAAARHKSNIENKKMNYIFCLNEHSDNTTLQTFVDPSVLGNIGRYANHSCDPNCVIVPVRVNTPVPKLALFSCKDIPPHSEITFHYGSKDAVDSLPVNGRRTKCLCNSFKCTGWMPYQMY